MVRGCAEAKTYLGSLSICLRIRCREEVFVCAFAWLGVRGFDSGLTGWRMLEDGTFGLWRRVGAFGLLRRGARLSEGRAAGKGIFVGL